MTIAAIHDEPNKPTYQKVAVLIGLGGCGKTQLALHYCQQSEQSGRFAAIFWVDATSSKTLVQSFVDIAKHLGKRQCHTADDEGNIRFSIEKLSDLKSPWLLVFDNFDDPKLFDGNIRKLFPNGNFGSILVSSRIRSANALGQSIEHSSMSEEESLKLLFHKNDHLSRDKDRPQALKVVQTLSYHALAVAQARAYIESRQMDFDAFLEDYRTNREFVLRETPSFSEYQRRMKPHAEVETRLSVFTTWELSFSQIPGTISTQRAKRHVLTLAGFFDRNAILEAIFRSYQEEATTWQLFSATDGAWNSQVFQAALKEMYNLSLVQSLRISKSGAEFSLHPLIQEWIKSRNPPEDREAYATEVILMLAKHIGNRDLINMSYEERRIYMPHVEAALDNDKTYLALGSRLGEALLIPAAQVFAYFFRYRGKVGPYLDLNESIVRLNEKSLGRKHPTILRSLSEMAGAYIILGRLPEAEKLLQEALKLQSEVLGSNHPETLNSMDALAHVLLSQNKCHDAQILCHHIMMSRIETAGQGHPQTLKSTVKLGISLLQQRKFAEAEKFIQLSLRLPMQVFREVDPETCVVLHSLAVALDKQGRHSEVEKMLRDLLERRVGVFGNEHLATVQNRLDLGNCLSNQKKYNAAEEVLRTTLELQIKMSGIEDAYTRSITRHLAYSAFRHISCQQTEMRGREELAMHTRILRFEHPRIIETADALALALWKQGKDREAEKLIREMSQWQAQALGERGLRRLWLLASVLDNQGKYEEAKGVRQEMLELRSQESDEASRAVISNELATIKITQDDLYHCNVSEKLLSDRLGTDHYEQRSLLIYP